MITPTRVIPRIRTEMRIDAMLSAGAAAYEEVFGKMVPTFVLTIAASQWSTECGIKPGTANNVTGGKILYSIWNNNWGNITCKPNADCDKHTLVTKERIKKGATEKDDIWKIMTLYYKSYNTPQEGAIDYWNKMKQYFPKSLKSFETGNFVIIAQTLSNERYYTDLVSRYTNNLKYFSPRYMQLLSTGKEILCQKY